MDIKKYPLDLIGPIVFILVFIATFVYSRFEPHVEDVDMNYVMQFKDKPGYILVDVRDEDVYFGRAPFPDVPGGHIPGAISFPAADLNVAAASAALAKAGITKRSTIIIYCNTGALAGRFADALIRRFNFSPSRLKNYRGSIRDWITDPKNILLPKNHE
ncbi:MAG: hypothetical protein IJR94_05935 [Synergistaceae bacterium]|nr:hypothetical protein [Synergistaceae bacterium]